LKRILITGGAGFIGSNLIRFLLGERPDWELVNLDALTYAGNLQSLADVEAHPRYRFVKGDICDSEVVRAAMEGCSGVFHLAAESHVDRSILDAAPFLRTNVLGTQVLLEMARQIGVGRFLLVSTDEVYGSLSPDDPPFHEDLPLAPNSPYSASKAGADLLAKAYFATYGLPVVITRCSNNYGPYQFPEKLIPLIIRNALSDRIIPVYGDGMQVRDWIYVEDHCRGLLNAFERGKPGEVYNLGGHAEMPNIAIVRQALAALGKPESLIRHVTDRPGHDRRYAMATDRAEKELGWRPGHRFEEALPATIRWYVENADWIESVASGAYQEYYHRQYGKR